MKRFLLGVGIFILITAGSFGLGLIDMELYEFWGEKKANADHEIWQEGKSHVEGVIDDLSQYRMEYIQADNDIEKKAIAQRVLDLIANFDKNEIENDKILEFIDDIEDGKIYKP